VGAYQSLAKRCGQVFVGGESMGGLLACFLASMHPEIAGLLLYAPAFRARRLWLTPIVHYFYRFQVKKNQDDRILWKGYKYHSTRAGYQLFLLQRVMESRFSIIHQPLSMFLGKRDNAISLSAAETVFDRIPSRNKSFHIYGESGHCMILDREKEIITNDSIRFIQDVLREKTE
jgi:carboxylesterase